ncbi:hypothetical protein BDV18DRAFT_161080 [Aspergillus unguis]
MTHLVWALLVALWASAVKADIGRTEIDLLFPRNDTYALMPLMPVVFAVQNPPLAEQLYARLKWGVNPLHNANASTEYRDEDKLVDVPSNDTTYYAYSAVAGRLNTKGNEPYGLHDEYGVFQGFHRGTYEPVHRLYFTTDDNGRQPDLVAITGGDDCDNTQAIAFDIEDRLKVPGPLTVDGVTSCALLAEPTPTPTPSPCQASIVSEVASSISASITAAEYSTNCLECRNVADRPSIVSAEPAAKY